MMRQLLNLGAAVIVAFTLSAMLPASQHSVSAASCYHNGCNKQDPNATGCSADAYTVFTPTPLVYQGQTWGYVDLRWSPLCGANWSRVRAAGSQANLTATVIRDADGLTYFGSWYGWTVWSPMVGGVNTNVHACGLVDHSYASAYGCTSSG
jgi:hypothetical protein